MAEVSQFPSDTPVPLFKKRSNKSSLRKIPATPPPAASDSNSEHLSEDETGRSPKRRRKAGVAIGSSGQQIGDAQSVKASEYRADKTAAIHDLNDATKHSDWYEENRDDDLSESNLLGTARSQPKKDSAPAQDGTYKGQANYKSYMQKNPNVPDRKVGPTRAPKNVRTITVTDFAPDVCKDYKLTGFCGFGDSCKFLHAREDYKQGWELDRDWEIGTKGKKIGGSTVASANRAAKGDQADPEEAENELLENIPFACILCQQPYKYPITTTCGHYFCEKCALDRYKKTPNCAACGTGTGGVFNNANQLKRLLEKKRDRAKKRKEEARQAGEEISESEGESRNPLR